MADADTRTDRGVKGIQFRGEEVKTAFCARDSLCWYLYIGALMCTLIFLFKLWNEEIAMSRKISTPPRNVNDNSVCVCVGWLNNLTAQT